MSSQTAWKGRLGAAWLRLERRWANAWPWPRGRGIFYRFRPLLYRAGIFPARVQLEPGVNLLLDPHDVIQSVLLLDGGWEEQVWNGIAEHLREGSVFIDVGAHIGYYALKAAHAVGLAGRVVAIEPNARTRRLLEANVAASRAANVSIQPFACSDRQGDMTFYEGPLGFTGCASFSRRSAERFAPIEPSARVTVQCRKLDDIVAQLASERVDVIKIDVEGAELLVLEGALRTLSLMRPVLILEVIAENLAALDTTVSRLHAFLRQAGYREGRRLGETDWEFLPLAADSSAQIAGFSDSGGS